MPERGVGGHAWQGNVHAQGACVAGGVCVVGVCVAGACVVCTPPPAYHEIGLANARPVRILLECILVLMVDLGYIYIRAKAKAKILFDLLTLTHRCSINTQIGNNATARKRRHFRSNINAPLR